MIMKWLRRRGPIRHVWILIALLVLTPNTKAQNVEASRIVAVGDIHGDFDAFVDILKHAGILDASGRWSAGKTTLVQTGDYTDRGPKVRAAMDFLIDLEGQAKAAGGRVAVLLGNHEVMNLIGDLRDATPAIYQTFADAQSEKRREAAYDAYVKWCADHGSQFTQAPRFYQPVSKADWMAAHPIGYVVPQRVLAAGPLRALDPHQASCAAVERHRVSSWRPQPGTDAAQDRGCEQAGARGNQAMG